MEHMEETKKEKFTRLAEARTNAALKQIALLGNLANTSNYEYDQYDVDKVLKTLRAAVNELDNLPFFGYIKSSL